MCLAKRSTSLGEETLSFEVLFAHRAVEALTVVVIVERLDPPVACLHREAASETFCREQVVPVSFAIWQTVF